MEAWNGKVAVVTGASSGIGAALCKDLSSYDLTVVGIARRLDRLNELKGEIESLNGPAKFFPIQCDLTKREQINQVFDQIINKHGGVDILVNNAGYVGKCSIFEDNSEETMDQIMDTNFHSVLTCTKRAFKSMTDRNVPGYIINISSIASYKLPDLGPTQPTYSVYPCSKFAINALNLVLQKELNFLKQNKIRVSNISPGLVNTEMITGSSKPLKAAIEGLPLLEPNDVSNAIIYLLSTPPRVQIQDIIIKPAGEMI